MTLDLAEEPGTLLFPWASTRSEAKRRQETCNIETMIVQTEPLLDYLLCNLINSPSYWNCVAWYCFAWSVAVLKDDWKLMPFLLPAPFFIPWNQLCIPLVIFFVHSMGDGRNWIAFSCCFFSSVSPGQKAALHPWIRIDDDANFRVIGATRSTAKKCYAIARTTNTCVFGIISLWLSSLSLQRRLHVLYLAVPAGELGPGHLEEEVVPGLVEVAQPPVQFGGRQGGVLSGKQWKSHFLYVLSGELAFGTLER